MSILDRIQDCFKYLDKNGLAYMFRRGVKFEFTGTQTQWDALTDEEKNKYDVAHILDSMSSMYLNMPVGVVLPYMGTVAPIGWLFCDWSEFDPTEYPKLSAVLTEAGLDGTHTPDMREVTLVGAGQNDTDTIASHDVYTLGQFKDDQLQNITGNVGTRNGGASGAFTSGSTATSGAGSENWSGVIFNASRVARTGTVTRGKRKGVNYIICAK